MSRFHLPSFATALFLGASLSATPASAGVISFVSAKGVNAGDCSSPASPCQTLGFALNQTVSGGEIKIVDPGNYIAVTIDKSITITGVDGASLNRGSAGAAMTINAGATDVVTIRNLIFDGVKQGATNGILLNSAGFLMIKNCVFQNFSDAGIVIIPTTALKFLIEDTIAAKNLRGILVNPSTAGNGVAAVGALNRVSSVNNGDRGMRVQLGGTVTVSDSVFAGNISEGILVGSTLLAGGVVRLTRSTLTNNAIGIKVLAGSTAESMGDNAIRGNTIDVTGTLTNVGTR